MTVTIGLTFTNSLSIAPQSRKPTICRAIVERLTPSSRARPFQSGLTSPVTGSRRRRSAFKIRTSKSNGRRDGLPLGLPVARCGLFFTINLIEFYFRDMRYYNTNSCGNPPRLRECHRFKPTDQWVNPNLRPSTGKPSPADVVPPISLINALLRSQKSPA